jgi:hypothetical protein
MQDKYVGRPKSSVPMNISISRPEAEWLVAMTPGRSRGRFLSQLIAAERSRLEERQKIQSEMKPAAVVD